MLNKLKTFFRHESVLCISALCAIATMLQSHVSIVRV